VRFSTAELAVQLRGELVGQDVTVDGASIDSRLVAKGQLFIPIMAERDGHEFVPAALEAGAAAYLTSHPPVGGTAIVVEDTRGALTALGALARSRVAAHVVGITGSVGKTTTKDLVAGCLAASYRTAASVRSLNNELGVPLTLLNAPDAVEWIVLEMGARGPGHIQELADLTRPDVGVVTSVSLAHIEFFGDLDGVARAKSELVTSLPTNGLAILNFDDALVHRMAERSPCPVLGYGMAATADVTAEDVAFDDDLEPRFTLVSPWGRAAVALRLHGAHQVGNALAAAAAALWGGVPLDAVAAALGAVSPSSMRMDLRRPAVGPVLIVDCYNANPASLQAALHSLAALGALRKVALLGPMAELGAETEREHDRIATIAQELGIEVIGYRTALYGPDRVDTVGDAVERMRVLSHSDALLIKGSRVVCLEDAVAAYGTAIGESSLTPPL